MDDILTIVHPEVQLLFSRMGHDAKMDSYSTRLLKALRARGVTTQRLADHLDVSYQAIKKVLDGKSAAFSLSNHYQTVDFLHVSSRWLATGDGDMDSPDAISAPDYSRLATLLASMFDQLPEDSSRLIVFADLSRRLSNFLLSSKDASSGLPEPADFGATQSAPTLSRPSPGTTPAPSASAPATQ